MPNSPYQEERASLEQLVPSDRVIPSTQADAVPSLSTALSQLPQRYLMH